MCLLLICIYVLGLFQMLNTPACLDVFVGKKALDFS